MTTLQCFQHTAEPLGQHVQGLCELKPDKVTAWKGEDVSKPPPLAELLLAMDSCWEKESHFFF